VESRPSYATELEKLKPAKFFWHSCSPSAEGWLSNGEGRMIKQREGYWKLGFVFTIRSSDCTEHSIALTQRRDVLDVFLAISERGPSACHMPRAKIAQFRTIFPAWRFYFKAQRAPSLDRKIGLAVDSKVSTLRLCGAWYLVSQFTASEH
jgi:hypothetical protein